MKNCCLLYAFIFTVFSSFSQNQNTIYTSKSKVLLCSTIGIDSAIYYNNKIFTSKKPIDLAFAYSAKRFLLSLKYQTFNNNEYEQKIVNAISKVPLQKKYFSDLSTIYNLSGSYYMNIAQYNKAIDYYVKAEEMAVKGNSITSLIKIKTNKANIKGKIGLEEEAVPELKSVLQLLEKNKSDFDALTYKNQYSNTLKSIGNLYCNSYKSKNNKTFLDSSSFYFNKMLKIDKSKQSRAYAYSNLGIINQEKNLINEALQSFEKSLTYYDELQQINESNYVKFYIGSLYFQKKDYKKSKKIFLNINKSLAKDTLKSEFYIASLQHLSLIYSEEQKKDSAYYFLRLYNQLFEEKTRIDNEKSTQIYTKLYQNDFKKLQENLNNEKEIRIFYFIMLVVLVVSFVFIVFYIRNKNEKKFQKIINDFNKNSMPSRIKIPQNKISNEQEEKILKELKLLEDKLYFLKPEFNQYNAAKKINTNTTYLSQIILKYKNCSFSEYTNNLRIEYLIAELMINTKIRGYTIQALAELIGYKNGTSFSKIFKNKTGVSPYQFIERLKKEK